MKQLNRDLSRPGLKPMAIDEKLARRKLSRLARECAKLDPKVEKALAEEGLGQEPQTEFGY